MLSVWRHDDWKFLDGFVAIYHNRCSRAGKQSCVIARRDEVQFLKFNGAFMRPTFLLPATPIRLAEPIPFSFRNAPNRMIARTGSRGADGRLVGITGNRIKSNDWGASKRGERGASDRRSAEL